MRRESRYPLYNVPLVWYPGNLRSTVVSQDVGWWRAEARKVRWSAMGRVARSVVVTAQRWVRLLSDRQEGQTLFEYAITVFFVVIACIALLSALGVRLGGPFTTAAGALQ